MTHPQACDWHGCTRVAEFNVRRDLPRGDTFTSLMWARCTEHTPTVADDGLHVSPMAPAPTIIVCSECNRGHYVHVAFHGNEYECNVCGHSITTDDLTLDPFETLTYTFDGLAYVTTD